MYVVTLLQRSFLALGRYKGLLSNAELAGLCLLPVYEGLDGNGLLEAVLLLSLLQIPFLI